LAGIHIKRGEYLFLHIPVGHLKIVKAILLSPITIQPTVTADPEITVLVFYNIQEQSAAKGKTIAYVFPKYGTRNPIVPV
jgi:hypothetical protein